MSEHSKTHPTPPPPPGTQPSLEGYFYQLDVSVLFALKLLLANPIASTVVLEPVESQEDLEVDIRNEPQMLVEQVDLGNYRLVIQCKLRETGPWQWNEIATLLSHGTRRPSAVKRLADENIRYLLVTSADVEGVLWNLRVADFGTWPAPAAMPSRLGKKLPATAPGRVAVLAALDQEKLASRLKALLIERFRIPAGAYEACRRDLHDEAWARMRGAADGVWNRPDLEHLIVKHGGYWGTDESLDGFVPPNNWDSLRSGLQTHHAVILSGPSGTGKTRTARVLVAHLRDELPGAQVVEIDGGPEKISREQRFPVIFYIEDPWGKYERQSDAVAWDGAIHSLLHQAGPQRKFVITSRPEMLSPSATKQIPSRFIGRLEAQHYGRSERLRLFNWLLGRLPARLQPAVLTYGQGAVQDLEIPLEIKRFFEALRDGPQDDEGDGRYVRRCLHDAQQRSIEQSILFAVQQRKAHEWAAVVWGLFVARGTQTSTDTPLIQTGLTERDLKFEDGLDPYLYGLVAGHNLRQSGTHLTYQHPRVEKGLQQAIEEKPGASGRALKYLTETLIDLADSAELDWASDGAIRIVAEAKRRLTHVPLQISAARQKKLDDWIQARLRVPDNEFEDVLKRAALVGSQQSTAAEVARWLLHTGNDEFALDVWRPSTTTPEWLDQVRADPITGIICAAFIRRMLERTSTYYKDNFPQEIAALAASLGPAFRDAALSIVRDGYVSNGNAIIAGALVDLDDAEPILERCIDYLKESQSDSLNEEWRALNDGHYDDEVEEHYVNTWGEQGHTAGQFISAYVEERRNRSGWTGLRDHPRQMNLLAAWIRQLRSDAQVSAEEWVTVANLTARTEQESEFWEAADAHWLPALTPIARARLIDGDGHEAAREALAGVFARHLTAQTSEIVQELLRCGPAAVLGVGCHLRRAALSDPSEHALALAINRMIDCLPPPLNVALRIATDPSNEALGIEALSVWRSLDTSADRHLELAKVRARVAAGEDVSNELDRLLVPTADADSENARLLAVLEVAIDAGAQRVIEACLKHRFAALRIRAMTSLAQQTDGPISSNILGMAGDPSSKVRKRLLQLLEQRPHSEHVEALMILAADSYTPEFRLENASTSLPIAEGAAKHLLNHCEFEPAQCQKLLTIALETSSDDVSLTLFRALVRNPVSPSSSDVLSAALEANSSRPRRLAATALFLEGDHVESTLLDRVTPQHLLKAPSRVAFPLGMLLGSGAAEPAIEAAAKAIDADPERRTLLVSLYIGLLDREAPVAQLILRLMPGSLGPDLAVALRDGTPLSADRLGLLRGNSFVSELLIREATRWLYQLANAPAGARADTVDLA
jgi:hypothetical protein